MTNENKNENNPQTAMLKPPHYLTILHHQKRVCIRMDSGGHQWVRKSEERQEQQTRWWYQMEWLQICTIRIRRKGGDDDDSSGGYERQWVPLPPFLSRAGSYLPKSDIFILRPSFSIFITAVELNGLWYRYINRQAHTVERQMLTYFENKRHALILYKWRKSKSRASPIERTFLPLSQPHIAAVLHI